MVGESAPVKVMHLVYTLRTGGMEKNVVKLVNALDPLRVRSAICSCTPADDLKHEVREGVPVHELNRRAGNDIRFVATLARLLRAERPHVLHTHGWGTLVEGYVAARLSGVPRLVHGEHGTTTTGKTNLFIQRAIWRRCDRVLSVSRTLADRMASETGFDRARITVIPNGLDVARFQPAYGVNVASVKQPDGAVTIGTVGRLVPVKDHTMLLQGLATLRDRGVGFRAVLVGDGPLRGELVERVAELRLDAVVTFAGHRPDVENCLHDMDLFVLTSKSEGLSNTIMEAMAAGLPVVATAVGGNPELVEHGVTGVLVPPGDSSALTDALESLATDSSRRRSMGAAGGVRVRVSYDLTRMLNAYEALYSELGP